MSPKSVLLIGAGELGLSILTALASKFPLSTSLTILLRPSTASLPPTDPKVSAISDLKRISILPLDIVSTSVSALTEVFKPFDVVIGALGYTSNEAGEGTGLQLKIAQAVLDAGVQLYIPWQFGVDYDIIGSRAGGGLFAEQCEVRTLLRSSDTPKQAGGKTDWIIVSTGMFTSYLFQPFFGVVTRDGQRWKVSGLGGWENKVTVTTPKDIGILTAEVVAIATGAGEEASRIRNSVVYLAGDTLSYYSVARIIEEVVGAGQVDRGEANLPEQLESELAADPSNMLKKYRAVFGAGNGVSWSKDQTLNARLGIDTETVEGWARANLLV